ncbi:hypothetical protein DYBT9623_04158 [Dyadobacter sp. CECT 9623]|uniref:PKD domain-containing protein n=1 Tax=Dyadobacter linearis TaxID=2823330 RepID=A0ABM8UV01_9BACT|nr:hypothetical protein [Dyadobacter sp. CECT 9623]CAG5072452.1 hypothetical protein DYBT9623_04158 [Dyadobacter sp. CECT 9623]
MENGKGQATQIDHLDYGCQLISEIYGKPDIAEWTNSDFIRLSHILYKKTRVQISPNTLKRIFGKIKTDARYYPQKATRDALANYIGYPDWDSFATAKPLPSLQQPVVHEAESPVTGPFAAPGGGQVVSGKLPVSRRYAWKILAGLIVLIALIGVAEYYAAVSGEGDVTAEMICRNPEGGNPHSAFFALKGIRTAGGAADYHIEFGDGRKMKLTDSDSVVSHYYEVPGRFLAVLKKDQQVLDSATIYLKSTGWTATARMMYDSSRVYPIEIPNLLSGGKHSVTAEEVARAGVDTNRTFFIDFINTHLTDINGDNFDLVARVRTSHDRAGVRCSQVKLTVFGESTLHMIDIMKPGCVHWSKLQFSEVKKSGRNDGLEFLGADLREGGTIRLSVKEKHAKLYINGELVHEASYRHALNRVYGLGLMFAGIGTIESVTLTDLKTGKAFDGNF